MKKAFNPAIFLRTVLVLSGVLALLAFRETWFYILAQQYAIGRSKRLILLIVYGLNAAGAFLFLFWNPFERLFQKIENIALSRAWKFFALLALLVAGILPALIIIFDTTRYIQPLFPMIWISWWLATLTGLLLSVAFRGRIEGFFMLVLLTIGFAARVESWVPFISTYPFSLGWSEASRYYYASLFYGERIYGQETAWSFLHPTRYLLQSIPFLFGQMPLWFHRAWQVFLWFSLTSLTSFAFAKRLKLTRGMDFLAFALWFFIFILQGAVYYHLQVAVLIILFGTRRNDLKGSLVALIFASLWAGISRVNWIPVPAMLTIFLFLLEEPVSAYKNLWDYLKKPIVWTVVGLGAAFASQSLYVFISGNSDNIASFGSSFTSSLLWYRLFPNSTYGPGIILSVFLVSFPLFGLLFSALSGKLRAMHWIRHLGTWSILLVLLAGGLIVSTKIGGGGDLHNMDAYLVVFALWAGYLVTGQIKSENGDLAVIEPVGWHWVVLTVALPFWMAIRALSPLPEYDFERAQQNLETLQYVVRTAYENNQEVLFINQRHLLSLGMVAPVALEENYEVVELMEMAMSGNEPYLQKFYDDLNSQRFAVIIATPQFTIIKDEEMNAFAEENNAWVSAVSQHILCTYERGNYLKKEKSIVLYVPRAEIRDCQFGE